jgi:hypothetical protein
VDAPSKLERFVRNGLSSFDTTLLLSAMRFIYSTIIQSFHIIHAIFVIRLLSLLGLEDKLFVASHRLQFRKVIFHLWTVDASRLMRED